MGGLIVIAAIIGYVFLRTKKYQYTQNSTAGNVLETSANSPMEELSSGKVNLDVRADQPSGRVQYD
jgi:hypothetical protein